MKIYVKLFVCISLCVFLTSCSLKTDADGKKLKDLDFTVVEEENISGELKNLIDSRKNEPFETTFEEGDDLYIVKGYGTVTTGGYSIGVTKLYETEKCIVAKFDFMGPSKEEEITAGYTYPYIVIKLKKKGKPVKFKE